MLKLKFKKNSKIQKTKNNNLVKFLFNLKVLLTPKFGALDI